MFIQPLRKLPGQRLSFCEQVIRCGQKDEAA